jgi:hypothetical protein
MKEKGHHRLLSPNPQEADLIKGAPPEPTFFASGYSNGNHVCHAATSGLERAHACRLLRMREEKKSNTFERLPL